MKVLFLQNDEEYIQREGTSLDKGTVHVKH